MAKNKGICTICGKGGKLTFEHVPAKATGNDEEVVVYGIEQWLARDLETGEMPGGYIQPKGTGAISICKACNEYCGVDWKVVGFQVNQMRALPVVKQVIASLLALNAPGFAAKNPDLRKFVLDREIRGLPDKYRLYACLFAGPLARFAGLQAELNVVTHEIVLMSEVAHPPFAYLLTIDSKPSQPLGEITAFTTRGFDEVRDEQLELTMGFGHTALPGDYRSKAMVDAEVAANDALMKANGPIVGQSDGT